MTGEINITKINNFYTSVRHKNCEYFIRSELLDNAIKERGLGIFWNYEIKIRFIADFIIDLQDNKLVKCMDGLSVVVTNHLSHRSYDL